MALTDKDVSKVRTALRDEMDEMLEEKLDNKLSQLKSDIFDRIDTILTEFITAR